MIYFNIKPIFILDSTKITNLKLDTITKRLATKHNSNFNVLMNEVVMLFSFFLLINYLYYIVF